MVDVKKRAKSVAQGLVSDLLGVAFPTPEGPKPVSGKSIDDLVVKNGQKLILRKKAKGRLSRADSNVNQNGVGEL